MHWLPLESNPDVMNEFIQKMGIKSGWKFVDVLGFDADLLMMVPRPVAAVLLLFPVSEEKKMGGDEEVCSHSDKAPYFMNQTITNACGTMALIHAIANNMTRIEFEPDSAFKKFIDSTLNMSPLERSKVLEGSQDFEEAHVESAQKGQTSAPEPGSDIDFHFVAFVEKDSHLYELDGRKAGPVCHGKTSPDSILEDAAKVCAGFMERCPGNLNFTAVALVQE